MSATPELKDAILTYLESTVLIQDLVGAFYDGRVPDGVTPIYPYIVSGPSNEVDSTLTLRRGDINVGDLRVWGLIKENETWHGHRQVEIVLAAIHQTLRRAKLVMPNNRLITIKRELSTTIADPNPSLVQGIYRYRAGTMML